MAAVCLVIHGFLLTNDGVIWDGWYFRSWLEHKNWGAFGEYAWSQGMPFSLLLLGPLSLFPNVVVAGMVAVVITLYLQAVAVYWMGLKLGALSRSEALGFAVLYQACPLVSAGQDFPMLTLLFFHFFFFAGGVAAALAMEATGVRHWLLRGAAIVTLMMSCWTNGSLLMVYGSLYVAWFCFFVRREGGPWTARALPFLRRYPDLLLLPPVTLWARNTFSPQFGWFENYNKPTTDVQVIWRTFGSFFENVLPVHLQASLEWVVKHPVLAVVLVVFLFAWPRFAPKHWVARRGTAQPGPLVWFALLSFLLGILPLAMIGKTFLEPVVGEFSRWSMHVPVPFGLVVIAMLRGLCFPRGRAVSRWFPAIIAACALFFGSQIVPVYVGERAEWVISRAVLHNMAKSEIVRGSSIVIFQSRYSLCRQDVYGVYSAEMVFGDQSRMLISTNPENGVYMIPGEIFSQLIQTALVPNEFKAINPAGQQCYVLPVPQREGLSNWDIAWRYLRLRWFGSDAELDRFFGSLCPIQARVQRPATPFPPNEPLPPVPASPHPRDRTTGSGVEMIYLPGDWWAGRFEVTQAQYERVMENNPSLFRDPHRPVERVTWYDADEFCRRVTEEERAAGRLPEGYIYRLPTSREFDAMRNTDPRLPVMLSDDRVIRWHTSRVGSSPPNQVRLHDVIGNVWEWSLDWWDRDERFKISLGGAWWNRAGQLQFTDKDLRDVNPLLQNWIKRLISPFRRDYPDQAYWDRGFRVVLARPASPQQEWPIDREPWRQKR